MSARGMTVKEAVKILLRAAGRDLMGAGCGLRALPTPLERARLLAAMQRAGRYAYGADYEVPVNV